MKEGADCAAPEKLSNREGRLRVITSDATTTVEGEIFNATLFGDRPGASDLSLFIVDGAATPVGCGVVSPRDDEERLSAHVQLAGVEGVEGTLSLKQDGAQGHVHIVGQITGLTPGLHGFHVHAVGNTSDGCKAAGAHYNPFMV